MFGLTSAGGSFGHLADCGVDICRGYGLGPLTKWVDDHLWLRIQTRYIIQYNELREQLRERVTKTGIIHRKGHLLYQGQALPNGQLEEFDDDFIFPIQNLLNLSPRSSEDLNFTYSFHDIDRVTLSLGYTWAADKDIPFCNNPTYFGFQWNLRERTVSVPADKRHKYLTAIGEWEGRKSHNAEHSSAMRHRLQITAHRADGQLTFVGPADIIDLHAYSDASSGFGVGVYIRGFWRAYRLLPGWRGEDQERDIGWAEAVGFYLLVIIISREASTGDQYKIWGDNEGVVEGWWNGRSRNRGTNHIFRCIHEITSSCNFQVHTRYVASAHNPADPFSRGARGRTDFLLPRINIPQHLQNLIIDYDAPYTAAERREYSTTERIAYEAKPRRPTSRPSYDQWHSEEEGRLLTTFEDTW
ncbi:hypothetical protein HHX47_DHR7000722 [Lentinula edodes]|nr:hypothetical protein HHX47_DHR7000722 [Lentinula edodes]